MNDREFAAALRDRDAILILSHLRPDGDTLGSGAALCSALRRMGKRLSGENAARLVFTVGRDAALLRQEMDKLCAYLGEREEIAAEDIDQICTRSTECTVFQMVDAQVAGNNDTAFALLGDMLRSGEDRVGILAMLLRQYRILYHMRCLMDERTPQALSLIHI